MGVRLLPQPSSRSRVPTERRAVPTTQPEVVPHPEMETEQQYVRELYGRLDAARDLAERRLKQAISWPAVDPQALQERDATVRFQTERVTALEIGRAACRERV